MSVIPDGNSLITAELLSRAFPGLGLRDDAGLARAARAELALTLQLTQQRVEQKRDPRQIIEQLVPQLEDMRMRFGAELWRDLAPTVHNHPVMSFFLEDPITRWSYRKPRGYAGDAELMDYIYGDDHVRESITSASPIGHALYDYTKNGPSGVAARERRDLITTYVDAVSAERGSDTEILAIAAGHLREARDSIALKEKLIKRWVALDQDPQSVGLIARDNAGTAVEAIDGSVRTLLMRGDRLGKFDLIYASGLYDYLTHKVAVKLTRHCVQMLKPGGTFLFANYSDSDPGTGYRETFMDWVLLLRSEEEMWQVINDSVDRNTVDAKVYAGENGSCLYATVRKLN